MSIDKFSWPKEVGRKIIDDIVYLISVQIPNVLAISWYLESWTFDVIGQYFLSEIKYSQIASVCIIQYLKDGLIFMNLAILDRIRIGINSYY